MSTSKPQGQIKALCELPGWIKYIMWRQHVSLWLDDNKDIKELSNAIKEMTYNISMFDELLVLDLLLSKFFIIWGNDFVFVLFYNKLWIRYYLPHYAL